MSLMFGYTAPLVHSFFHVYFPLKINPFVTPITPDRQLVEWNSPQGAAYSKAFLLVELHL
jgi:hypothetical protein